MKQPVVGQSLDPCLLARDAALPERVGQLIEGKSVRPDAIEGEVLRAGHRRLTVRLAGPVTVLANVRLRLSFPALGQESGDIYGKVLSGGDGGHSARIGITSVDAADQQILDALGTKT